MRIDFIDSFIKKCCVVKGDYRIRQNSLSWQFQRYCRANQIKIDCQLFLDGMAVRGYPLLFWRGAWSDYHYFSGIKLRPEVRQWRLKDFHD